MRKLATFIMAGRLQAVSIAVLLAILGVFVPPFTLLSGAVIALVALRKGAMPALVVIGWGTLLLSALTLGLFGQFAIGVIYAFAQWLPILGAALLLRRTVSWSVVMQAIALVGMFGVVLTQLLYPNAAQLWQGVLQTSLAGTLERIGMNANEASTAISDVAQYFTGIFAVSIALGVAISLTLGRAWQAMLYNPGGFREEFTQWRIGQPFALAMLVLVLAAVVLRNTLLVQLMLVGLVPFLLQALGLVHGLVKQSGMNIGWLIAMYALLVFATVQVAALLAAVALADCFVDIRSRLAKRP
ncbi:hypothetical protein [Acidihalobacter ferrooxydans]|uniref:DUF2232 domain-containing protein n=1 Tax=Acidihalobacter ferrooxydans TaxID=1765967 RepID=A0A1P8UG30_9GAMM|nr:hypothetical protein [Acidihalobacter ferrooxydans]APZ42765.1 hypothetical protein BW247_06375 [Acidihalobacter ferrooxydans]